MQARKLIIESLNKDVNETELLKQFQSEVAATAAESAAKYTVLPIIACASLLSACCLWAGRRSSKDKGFNNKASICLKK